MNSHRLPMVFPLHSTSALAGTFGSSQAVKENSIDANILGIFMLWFCFDGQTVNAGVSRAGCLEFKFRTGQILHSVANGSSSLQHLRK